MLADLYSGTAEKSSPIAKGENSGDEDREAIPGVEMQDGGGPNISKLR